MRDITDKKAQEWFDSLQGLISSENLSEEERNHFIDALTENTINLLQGSSEIISIYQGLKDYPFQYERARAEANNLWHAIQAYINPQPLTQEEIEDAEPAEILDGLLRKLEKRLESKYFALLDLPEISMDKKQAYNLFYQSFSNEAGYDENETPSLLNQLINNSLIDEEDKDLAREIIHNSRVTFEGSYLQSSSYQSKIPYNFIDDAIVLTLDDYFKSKPLSKSESDLDSKNTDQPRPINQNSALFSINQVDYDPVNYALFTTTPIMENISNRLDQSNQSVLAQSCKLWANFFKSKKAAQTNPYNSDEAVHHRDNKRKANASNEERTDNNNEEARLSSKNPKI